MADPSYLAVARLKTQTREELELLKEEHHSKRLHEEHVRRSMQIEIDRLRDELVSEQEGQASVVESTSPDIDGLLKVLRRSIEGDYENMASMVKRMKDVQKQDKNKHDESQEESCTKETLNLQKKVINQQEKLDQLEECVRLQNIERGNLELLHSEIDSLGSELSRVREDHQKVYLSREKWRKRAMHILKFDAEMSTHEIQDLLQVKQEILDSLEKKREKAKAHTRQTRDSTDKMARVADVEILSIWNANYNRVSAADHHNQQIEWYNQRFSQRKSPDIEKQSMGQQPQQKPNEDQSNVANLDSQVIFTVYYDNDSEQQHGASAESDSTALINERESKRRFHHHGERTDHRPSKKHFQSFKRLEPKKTTAEIRTEKDLSLSVLSRSRAARLSPHDVLYSQSKKSG